MARLKLSKQETYGRKIAKACARKPLTPSQILAKTGLTLMQYGYGLDWVKAQRSSATTPFLFMWEGGEMTWGFRAAFGDGKQNILWHIDYIVTRSRTTVTTMEHIRDSQVVAMAPKMKREWERLIAIEQGTLASIETIRDELVRLS